MEENTVSCKKNGTLFYESTMKGDDDFVNTFWLWENLN